MELFLRFTQMVQKLSVEGGKSNFVSISSIQHFLIIFHIEYLAAVENGIDTFLACLNRIDV